MKKISIAVLCLTFLGCSHIGHNTGNMPMFGIPEVEAEWIQNGEPIIFEGKEWYPMDRFYVLLDSELYFKKKYKDIPFFVQKIDVRPYQKIFTKFGRNKFRVFVPEE